MMFKTLTAGLMAITLTLSSASSAQAQGLSEEDIGKVLFGLLATAAIAHAINENKSDRIRREEPAPQVTHRQARPQGVLRHQSQPRRRVDHTVLPRDCVRRIETRRGTQRFLGRRCLQNNYARAASLPDQCAVRVRTDRGRRHGYDPRCLREMGYRLSRR